MTDERTKKVSGQSLDTWRATFDTNVFGLIATTDAFLPLLRKRRRVVIVNLSSILGSIEFQGNELCISGAWSMCSIRPGMEICNGIDDDCDGMTDEGLARDFFRDADHDGYGDDTMHMMACTAPTGYIAYDSTAIDCDDTMITVNRRLMLYPDFDRDGHGARTGELLCPGAAGYVTDSLDCNDQNATSRPTRRASSGRRTRRLAPRPRAPTRSTTTVTATRR